MLSPIETFPSTLEDFKHAARLEWSAAVQLGAPVDLSLEDRAYQQRCFERAESYERRAELAALKSATKEG